MHDNGFETVLIMRLLSLPFLLATALGSLPGTVSFVLLGASIDRVDEGIAGIDPATLVSVVIFVVSLALTRLLRRRQSVTIATPTTTITAEGPTT